MRCVQADFEFEGATFGVRTWCASDSEGPLPLGSSVPIVLLHGFAQSAHMWDAVAPLVAKGAGRVFVLDFAGHGASGAPAREEAFDLRFQARAVNELCRRVADFAGARPVLAGYSMGGRVALASACAAAASGGADDPGHFPMSALVLESAGLGPENDAERAALRQRNFTWANRLRCEGVAAFMDYWEGLALFESQKRLPEPVRARVREERLANSACALALTFERAGAHAMPSRGESLQALRTLMNGGIPVLYLAGELDAKYCAVARGVERDTSGAIETRIVSGAGHNTHLEQPEAFAGILGEACERVAG